ncbi:recombination regulator RecX [Atopobacter phocae]|uniref:recombination regulator RecX n=1 Tax=Atopobacter phocae TaxID=136492 RepID=UPI0004714487|nr:recombination regulator RecX [Atopobacter phocae]
MEQEKTKQKLIRLPKRLNEIQTKEIIKSANLDEEQTNKITSIQQQKKDKERFNIYIDGTFRFGVSTETLIKFGLLKGNHLSDEQLEEIESYETIERAYHKSLRYLSRRLRTEKEVEHYLMKEEVEERAIAQVMARLIKTGYLNDLEYAKSFVRTELVTASKGPGMIKQKLREKKVSPAFIEEALLLYELDDQVEIGWHLAEKYQRRLNKQSLREAKQKVTEHLMTKGFASAIITIIQERLNWDELSDDEYEHLDKQSRPILRRLSRKHKGSNLRYQVEGRLYQKGFPSELIAKWLDEQDWEAEHYD